MKLTVNFSGDKELPEYIKMMVAGAPGVGKTRFALTAPNPIIASCYSGLTTLALHDGTPYVNINCEQDLLNLKFALDADDKTRTERFGFAIDTIVVDTVDAIQRALVLEKMQRDRKDEFGPGDWMWLGQRCNAIFEGLSQLPMNVIFLLHTKQDTDGDKFWLKPGLQGAFVDQINQYVDYGLLLKANTLDSLEENMDLSQLTIGGKSVDGLVSVSLKSQTVKEDRYLTSKPTADCEWLHDYTNTLPPKFDLNFTDDFERIVEARRSLGELPQSTSSEIELDLEAPSLDRGTHKAKVNRPKPTKVQAIEPTTPTQTTDVDCKECGKKVETQDWVDISKMRYDSALCKTCFTNKRG